MSKILALELCIEDPSGQWLCEIQKFDHDGHISWLAIPTYAMWKMYEQDVSDLVALPGIQRMTTDGLLKYLAGVCARAVPRPSLHCRLSGGGHGTLPLVPIMLSVHLASMLELDAKTVEFALNHFMIFRQEV
jgi:hypothetical protein